MGEVNEEGGTSLVCWVWWKEGHKYTSHYEQVDLLLTEQAPETDSMALFWLLTLALLMKADRPVESLAAGKCFPEAIEIGPLYGDMQISVEGKWSNDSKNNLPENNSFLFNLKTSSALLTNLS